MSRRRWPYLLVRLATGAVFVGAGASKAAQRQLSGSSAISLYTTLTSSHAVLHAVFPIIEVLLGLWVISGKCLRLGAIFVLLAISAFSGFILRELLEAHPKPCGCFIPNMLGVLAAGTVRVRLTQSLIMNGLLALFAVIYAFEPTKSAK